jgi:ribosomal protein L11 methyltransferase
MTRSNNDFSFAAQSNLRYLASAMNYIEVSIESDLDSGELLSLLDDDGASLGSWEKSGIHYLYWPEEKWSKSILADLQRALALLGVADRDGLITIRILPNQDWNEAWVASLKPIYIGKRIRIRQSWYPSDAVFDGFELVIDPRRAFGTGYHATTQLVIEWLETKIRGSEKILDIGTGSGILAMAAIRLGAASAIGIDNDPVAIECAREYGKVNGFGQELELQVSSFETITASGFDIIVANMDIRSLPNLCSHLPRLLKADGIICLSGLQQQDFDEITQVLAQTRLRIEAQFMRDEWMALEIK